MAPPIKHGHAFRNAHSPEYNSLRCMLNRCYLASFRGYADYGGRGISVCGKWAASFEAFLEDMGEQPAAGYSLDRIDNSGNYQPGNVRWASKKEQARNRSRNRMLTYAGKTMCLAAWANELGIHRAALGDRLRTGWSVERALSTVGSQNNPHCRIPKSRGGK